MSDHDKPESQAAERLCYFGGYGTGTEDDRRFRQMIQIKNLFVGDKRGFVQALYWRDGR